MKGMPIRKILHNIGQKPSNCWEFCKRSEEFKDTVWLHPNRRSCFLGASWLFQQVLAPARLSQIFHSRVLGGRQCPSLSVDVLKETVPRDFRLQVFFMNHVSEYPIRFVSNFFENSRRYSQLEVHPGVVDFIKHQYRRHLGFGVFLVIWSMVTPSTLSPFQKPSADYSQLK